MSNLIKISCPFCKSEKSSPWASENNYTAVKCENCGFVYLNPRPPMDSIDEKNKIGYHETKSDTFRSIKMPRINKIRSFKKRLLPILSMANLVDKKIDWLDVGAGTGELLYVIKKLLPKATLEGIEPSQQKVEMAQNYGLNVVDKTLEQIDKKYDVISLINVFSHLPEPLEFIEQLKEKLKPHGILILVTGNGGDVTASEYPDGFFFPDHLVFAGETHILQILKNCGFSIVDQKKYKFFLPEGLVIRIIKAVCCGNSLFNKGPFRSLWFVARLDNSKK